MLPFRFDGEEMRPLRSIISNGKSKTRRAFQKITERQVLFGIWILVFSYCFRSPEAQGSSAIKEPGNYPGGSACVCVCLVVPDSLGPHGL